MSTFDYSRLRKGDFVLLETGKGKARAQSAARVIGRSRSFPPVIGVRLSNGTEHWFDMKTGYAPLVAGARLCNGSYQAL